MEKISLKPIAKELLYKGAEENVAFDVFSYQGATTQEKQLGMLSVLGHVKYEDEDMSYLISLIASLAKREYYSQQSLQEHDPKKAFERTLKKLNEVLEDFFKNKTFKIQIGLAAIAGENIFLSRLGKFKVALARNGEYIDILNNVQLFSKDAEHEKQFANIVSGRLQPQDKLFAYFPARPVTSREKQLNPVFLAGSQKEFGEKVAQLASTAATFACCGVHIAMQEVKEIPVEIPRPAPLTPAEPEADTEERAMDSDEVEEPKHKKEEEVVEELPPAMPAELSVGRRPTILSTAASQFSKLRGIKRLNQGIQFRGFFIIAALVLVPLLVWVILGTGQPSEAKAAYKQAIENFKLAQTRLSQNDTKGARNYLNAALLQLSNFDTEDIQEVRTEVTQTLDTLDKVSSQQATQFFDGIGVSLNALVPLTDTVQGVSEDGKVYAFKGGATEVAALGTAPRHVAYDDPITTVFDGTGTFSVLNNSTGKHKTYALEQAQPSQAAALYQDNLYVLAGTAMYKYADVVRGNVKRVVWSEAIDPDGVAMAIDGNIHVLTKSGSLSTYFKGSKTGSLDLQVSPSEKAEVVLLKDSPLLYVLDPQQARVYIFEASSGTLQTTHRLPGSVKDIAVTPDGVIWYLTAANAIYHIR